jgi:hypothetical protein
MGLAGEFLVAGELLRRGVVATVAYGNAKKADVLAVYAERATNLEVKTTSAAKWVLGGTLPEASPSLWVLVHLPTEETEPPAYYILTSQEIREIVLPKYDAYRERYRQKYGKERSAKGVVSIQRKDIGIEHRGAWSKVSAALGAKLHEIDNELP